MFMYQFYFGMILEQQAKIAESENLIRLSPLHTVLREPVPLPVRAFLFIRQLTQGCKLFGLILSHVYILNFFNSMKYLEYLFPHPSLHFPPVCLHKRYKCNFYTLKHFMHNDVVFISLLVETSFSKINK